MKRKLIIIVGFFLISLFETTVLVRFLGINLPFSLITVLVIFINLFEKPQLNTGFLAAVFGGFLLDVFSVRPLGFHILIFLSITFLIKTVSSKYLKIPSFV